MKTRGLMGMALAAAMIATAQPLGASRSIEARPPRVLDDTTRRQRKRAEAALEAARINERNRLRRWKNRAAAGAFAQAVNSLSNWQRNQWAKAGYPGLRRHEYADALAFKKERAA